MSLPNPSSSKMNPTLSKMYPRSLETYITDFRNQDTLYSFGLKGMLSLFTWEYFAFKYEQKQQKKLQDEIDEHGTSTTYYETILTKYNILNKNDSDKKTVIYEVKLKPSYILNMVYEKLKFSFIKLGYYSATTYGMIVDILKFPFKYAGEFFNDLTTIVYNLIKPAVKIVISPWYYTQGFSDKLNELRKKYNHKNIYYFMSYSFLLGLIVLPYYSIQFYEKINIIP
jgi:hypothetical protein